MAHVAKYARAASGHLTAHYERRKVPVKNDESGEITMEYVKFGNQDIDPSRTHLNYNLAPERPDGQIEFIRQRISEARCLKRDDVKVMCSWVVTMPENFKPWDSNIMHISYNKDAVTKTFFERCYEFMANRYGEQNVISAYVHLDETSPHMHFAFVPVTEDEKRGGEKVSAKEVLTRTDLQTFHTDLESHLDSFRDIRFPVLNGATKDGNKEIVELKRERAIKQLEADTHEAKQELGRVQQQLEEADRERSQAQTKLEETKAELQNYYELKVDIDEVTISGANIFGKVAVKKEDLERLTEQAKAYVANRDEISNLRQAKQDLESMKADVEEERVLMRETLKSARENEKKYQELYNEQQELNNTLQETLRENSKLRHTVNSQERTINGYAHRININEAVIAEKVNEAVKSTQAELESLKATVETLEAEKATWSEKLSNAYESILVIVKAVASLNYDEYDGYKANLTQKQRDLVEAIRKYGAHWARQDGFPEVAKRIENEYAVIQSVEKFMPNQKQKKRSEMEYGG